MLHGFCGSSGGSIAYHGTEVIEAQLLKSKVRLSNPDRKPQYSVTFN